MDSNLHYHHHHHHHQHQQPQQVVNSGLTRYRSAPSSYFAELINTSLFGDSESDQILTRFASPAGAGAGKVSSTGASAGTVYNSTGAGTVSSTGAGGDSTVQKIMNQFRGYERPQQQQFISPVKQEHEGIYLNPQQQRRRRQQQQQHQQLIYQNQIQSLTDHNYSHVSVSPCSSTVDDSLTAAELPTNLRRQNSSPAGFLAHLDMDHGYGMMRSVEDFGGGRGNVLESGKRLKNEPGFSSGAQLSSGMLPRIPENESKVMGMKSGGNNGGFGSNSWDDSDILNDSFLKEFGESVENKMSSLSSSNNQHNDVGRIRAPTTLVHHLSLPASSAELDKLMQFQDLVPLKSRAKRGCATHPRSIAERVRRTRISERMRKLQDLVPNMDKQTNTADMLDLAVDYIKELQKEAETLSEHHAKCTCSHKQKV